MHFYKSILSFAAVHAASAQIGAMPTFPHLFYLGALNINITTGQQIPVYEGTRVLNSYIGSVFSLSPPHLPSNMVYDFQRLCY